MDKDEAAKLAATIMERAAQAAIDEYEPKADDGLEIARALLQVLGRRFGLGFVLDVQREVLDHADTWSTDADPMFRADAGEIVKVANAGYFTDLIDELSDKLPAGRA